MGKLIRSSALVLLLACSASAGVMTYGVYEPPPPPPAEHTMQYGPPEAQSVQESPAETSLLVRLVLSLLALP